MYRLYLLFSLAQLSTTLGFEIGCAHPVQTKNIPLKTKGLTFLAFLECVRACTITSNCDVIAVNGVTGECTAIDCPYIFMPNKSFSECASFRVAVNGKSENYNAFSTSANHLTTGSRSTDNFGYSTAAYSPSTPILEEICHADHIDAFTKTSDGSLYAFSGSLVFKFASYGLEPGWPRPINEVFRGAPNDIDAAVYNWKNEGYIYFFKGNRYWKFKDLDMDTQYSYPASVADDWEGLPCSVDSAFIRYKNGKIYFTEGDVYYRYDDEENRVRSGYPASLYLWDPMLPDAKISAALQDNTGKNYFFGEDNFYEQNEDIDGIADGFPLSIAKYWFGCHKTCPDYCGAQFDAFTTTSDHAMYGFAGTLVFKFVTYGLEPGWPKPIAEIFKGLPDDIDAALYNWSGKENIYFFKGDSYWRYNDFELETAYIYPAPIWKNWKGIPNNVNAAFVRENNRKSYIIKGDEYYRVSNYDKDVDDGYPKSLSEWDPILVGANISAAFQDSTGITYFFGRDQFYKYDEDSDSVADGYPLSISTHWLRCSCREN